MLHQAHSIQDDVRPGAERSGMYFPRLKGKKLGIVANQTSLIGKTHLVDSLAALGRQMVSIRKLFGPEHGFSSFVGLHEVPVVYGMTIGEYARMINREGWLGRGLACNLTVIPCEHYSHRSRYILPVPPSPNLPTMNSIFLYPCVCFFEGTVISEGRGTNSPFEVFGHPELQAGDYSFTPESIPGADSHPKLIGKLCRGKDLRYLSKIVDRQPGLNLSWLIYAYNNFPDKDNFFTPFFDKLAGTARLRHQIIEGLSEEEIRTSWADDLASFKKSAANT